MGVSVSKSVELSTLSAWDCIWPPFYVIPVTGTHSTSTLALHKRCFQWFLSRQSGLFWWLMKVLCSHLGPSMDAIRSLTLYPWYSPQHAKGCLLHAPPGCVRTLSAAGPASIVGWPKCPAVLVPPKKQLAGVMRKPEVTCGTKLRLFAPLTILTIYHSWLPLSCLISLSLKGFPRNTSNKKLVSGSALRKPHENSLALWTF